MYCKKCGAQLEEEAKFCPDCGEKVGEETPSENNAQEAVTAEETSKFDEIKSETAKLWGEVESTVATAEEEPKPITEEESVSETAEAPVQTEQAPVYEEAAQPPIFEKDIAPIEEKKSKKGLIIGISAAAVVVGGAAIGYFCFNNELARLFMGDVGFAKMIEDKTYSYMNSHTELENGEFDKFLAQYMDQMSGAYVGAYTGENFKEMFDAALKESGDTQVKVSVDIEPGILLSLGGTTNGIFDMISDIELIGSVAHSEEFNKITMSINESGERLIGSDIFVTAEKMFMLFPELSDKVLYSDLDFSGEEAEESIEQAAEKPKFAPEEAKRIREKLTEIYDNSFGKAKIEYGKADETATLAGNPAKGDYVSVTWDSELIDAMIDEAGEFLKNDEYLRNYFTTAFEMEISEYEAAFDEEENEEGEGEDEEKVTIQSVTYYAAHAEIKGKSYYISDGDDDAKVEFIRLENGADMSFDVLSAEGDDRVFFKMSDRKGEEEGSGNIELVADFSKEENNELVLDIAYSNVGVGEYNGNQIPTGNYKLSVSEKDKLLASALNSIGSLMVGGSYEPDDNQEMSEEFTQETEEENPNAAIASILSSSYIEWGTAVEGDTLKNTFAIYINTLLKATINYDYMPYTAENLVMPDTSDAIDLNGDSSEIAEEFKKECIEKITKLGEKSPIVGFILEQTGLNEELQKAEEAGGYAVNYAAYSDEIRENAPNVAYELSSAFTDDFYTELESYSLSVEENNYDEYIKLMTMLYTNELKTVKLYYDANGNVTVIDDAGYYFYDFGKLAGKVNGELKNCYVELLSDGTGSAYYRANIVYTDDMNNLPQTLPNMYNYFDGVFEWNGDANSYIHDGFILGTSEYISEGVSTIEFDIAAVQYNIAAYDGYAENIYYVVNEFFAGKSESFYERAQTPEGEDYGTLSDFSVVVEKTFGGEWAVKQCLVNNQEYKALEVLSEDITAPNSEFVKLLNEKLGHINDVKAEILINVNPEPTVLITEENGATYSKEVYSTVIGVGAVPAESTVDFAYFGAPEYYDYESGYFYNWGIESYGKPNVPGVYFVESGEAVPFGSYCYAINGPFGDYETYMNFLFGNM